MTTYRFEQVDLAGEKNLSCPVCGKKLKRRTTFSQTINPWNRNAAGQPKTRREIHAELITERAGWMQVPATHGKCQAGPA